MPCDWMHPPRPHIEHTTSSALLPQLAEVRDMGPAFSPLQLRQPGEVRSTNVAHAIELHCFAFANPADAALEMLGCLVEHLHASGKLTTDELLQLFGGKWEIAP